MGQNAGIQNFFSPKKALAASFIVCAYWITGNFINIYSTKPTGVIFEILWLPMLLLLLIIPALSIFLWAKTRFKFSSLYFFAVLMMAFTMVIIIAKK